MGKIEEIDYQSLSKSEKEKIKKSIEERKKYNLVYQKKTTNKISKCCRKEVIEEKQHTFWNKQQHFCLNCEKYCEILEIEEKKKSYWGIFTLTIFFIIFLSLEPETKSTEFYKIVNLFCIIYIAIFIKKLLDIIK
jgi:hypothetical protein